LREIHPFAVADAPLEQLRAEYGIPALEEVAEPLLAAQ
jgi:hypothetical protein